VEQQLDRFPAGGQARVSKRMTECFSPLVERGGNFGR
jgi:hypothetical protein